MLKAKDPADILQGSFFFAQPRKIYMSPYAEKKGGPTMDAFVIMAIFGGLLAIGERLQDRVDAKKEKKNA